MRGRHQEALIVGSGASSAGLGWVMLSMVYLAILASSAAFYAQTIALRWSLSLSDTVTVQVTDPGTQAGATTRLGVVLEVLRETPAVGELSVFDMERTRTLLDPWMGAELARKLPLPVLIDLRLKPGADLSLTVLGDRLAAVAPGTVIDDHANWLKRVGAITATLAYGGWLVVLLLAGVSALSVVFAIKSALATNHDTITLLHLIGARDSYVAARFQNHVLKVVLPASIFGSGLAVVTVLAVMYLVGEVMPAGQAVLELDVAATTGFFREFEFLEGIRIPDRLQISHWLAIAVIPAVFASLATLVARLAVLLALRRDIV